MSSAQALLKNGERLLDSLGRWSELSEAEREEVDCLLVQRSQLISLLELEDLDPFTKRRMLDQDGALLRLMREAQKRLRRRSKQNGYGPKTAATTARYIDQAT